MSEDKMNESEINAMISLLDDSDEEVLSLITTRLLSFGEKVLPILEDRYLTEPEFSMQARIHNIIDKIHSGNLKNLLQSWAEDGGKDLFEGIFLVSKLKYPDLDKQFLNNQLDKIKLDAWLELNFQLAPLDKVRILNYVLFDLHGLKGNAEDYHAPDNSFINRVLETKQGNPISLAIIYSIIAQRLNIPIFGVNLPQHFILAYKDDSLLKGSSSFKGNVYMEYDIPGEVLFYINAFNKGAIFSKWNIDQFLKQLNIKPLEIYYEPCSNVDIILRVFRNLIFSYEKLRDDDRLNIIKELISVIQPYASIF
jgi:hypothetical protein